ncbi:MAG: negative regulator of flagellin synthesis FlgM [bacterium]|jgi:negative regulator of flagellin synthesis FlgM
MKISNQYTKLPLQETHAGQKKGKEGSSQLGAIEAQQSVQQTGNNFAINRIRMKIDAESGFNAEKVNALKAKIQDGSYKIDADKVAKQLLKHSLLEDL